jgi:glycosyltransferase involved in cell wall biosynthesis
LLSLIASIFLVALSIQILYYIIVFSRFLVEKKQEIDNNHSTKGVSVVVCAWNEFDNLVELLPILGSQQYPDYEVVIVDDCSNDGTSEYLKNEINNYKNFKIVTITERPEHMANKKYALSLGIKVTTKELLLLTDADCRPASDQWITGMVQQMGYDKQIVLGFSPYTSEPCFLNSFIRFETFFTAWQYFSYTLLGIPYMGVGRNLMYRRKLFFDNLGFRNHQKIVGGDDDLFVNETSNAKNTAICYHPDTFTFSEPKHNFAEWFIQKKRHLSIGKRYKTRDKILLGLYSLTHIIIWLLWPILFFVNYKFHLILAATFLFRILVYWIFGGIANAKLQKPIAWFSLPLYDFLLAVYYITMGSFSIFSNKKLKWR